jgi:hypothetical protein
MIGGAIFGDTMFTWGEGGLARYRLPDLEVQDHTPGNFRAGCAFDGGLALQSGTDLIWRGAGEAQLIDTEAAAIDMTEAKLFGRTGLLLSHHGIQVRFYQRGLSGDRWPYREIYSFYTASEQGGFLLHDIDADGRPDIVCGNYWIQSPPKFELPWRLFAINLFHEHPLAASARLAWWRGKLLWLESKRSPARSVLFAPPRDPRGLWTAEPVPFDPPLAFPRAVLGRENEIWIGEDNGPASRIVRFPSNRIVRQGVPTRALLAWRDRVIAVGPTGPAML